MYSGKSEELQRLIKRSMIAGKKCQTFKPAIDDRYGKNAVITHDVAKIVKELDNNDIKELLIQNTGICAQAVKDSEELLSYIEDDTQVIGIDEIQFFDNNIIDVVDKLNKRNIRVIMSGLDLYANGDIFPITSIFACKCKYIEKVHAVCVSCGGEAMYSYRIDNNEGNNKALINIGSSGKYIAICETCKENLDKENGK